MSASFCNDGIGRHKETVSLGYGESYYKESNQNDQNWFDLQKQHASPNFAKEQNTAKELIQLKLYEQRVLTLKEIDHLLINNLLIALVDAGQLSGKDKPAGHFVLVYNSSEKFFNIHDPGLPHRKVFKKK